ncbi:hypothetical protein [Streptomyces sp. NBC_01750]|uniref:hypothetical protein n=1 Tax=Streptomyces sp. NBC_01750 TaxID=2975928 RepID=UPI002DD9D866|nr:hypothetical protein [Streptomyces sp. NBC_01750]WSD30553.1 hypothetical protein OG966_00280 [Streptomyces sp. NBC_01750]
MTQMTPPLANPDTANSSAPEPPFVSLHTAVVLLTALVIGLVIGGLTALADAPIAVAVLAGLTGAGPSVPALRSLIDRHR